MTITYIRRTPSPPLDRYIDYFYYLDGQMPFHHEKVLPIPALDLKINLGGAFQMYEGDSKTPRKRLTESWLVGLFGVHHSVDWPADMRLYGVHFKPDGAYPFLGFPLSELYNQAVALDAVWGRWASHIREQLHAAPSIEAGLALFERLISERFCEDLHVQKVVSHGISVMSQKQRPLSIRELSEQIGISQNHLGNLFKRVVGTSAKELARLYRFEHVLRFIDQTHPIDWTQTALRLGYYDLSHLNKDFVAFTGHSPTSYLKLLHQRYNDDSVYRRIPRLLPVD